MPTIYHVDDSAVRDSLIRPPATEDRLPEVFPRKSVYGSKEAEALNLIPYGELVDQLVSPLDYKEVIQRCHANKVFAVYHEERSGVMTAGWNQNGYGYCWAYGLTAATMAVRALEHQSPVRLSPFSLGWMVGWRNQGYYCDQALGGASQRGIASVEFVPEHVLNPAQFKPGWEEDALRYRPLEWFDTPRNFGQSRDEIERMIQYAISILSTGCPLYIAYDWWGHALECVYVRWDVNQPYNLVWGLRNSHGETEPIELTGTRAVPNEAYGVRSVSIAN